MADKILDVTVDISTAATSSYLGFGIPLILIAGENATEVPYTECASAGEVAAAVKDTALTSDAYKIANLIFAQDYAPRTVAVYGSTKAANVAVTEIADKNWRQLILGNREDGDAALVSEAVETLDNKMFFVSCDSLEEIATVFNMERDRSVAFLYNNTSSYAEAALVGASAGRAAGSFTYKNLILKGIDPLVKTAAEIKSLHQTGGITFVTKAGDNVTTEGITTSGEYIDVIDSKDYIISQIEYRVQKLLNNAAKLPYTNAGIAAIESEVVGVLNDAYNNGMIDEEDGAPAYTVNFKTREEMSAADRASRIYKGGNFTFKLAGAIHTVTINGELVI